MGDNMTTITMLVHKLRHSHGVAQNCRELAMALGHTEDVCVIAEFMGYTHDIGSMAEILRIGRWLHIGNHGMEGRDILFDVGLHNVVPAEYSAMFDAIKLHNKVLLMDASNKLLMILRDADKLEILRYVGELIDAGRLQWLCDNFYEHTTTPKELCSSLLLWLDDINYAWTRQQIMRLDIIHKLMGVVG
jgi:hypothetical protein